MKFILKEDLKFILAEKFILNETTSLTEAQATIKQLGYDLTKLETLAPKLITQLANSATLSLDDDLKKSCAEVLELLTKTKDFTSVVKEFSIKVKEKDSTKIFSETVVAELQPLCYHIASVGDGVQNNLNNIKKNKGDLASQIEALKNHLPQLQADLKKLYSSFETLIEVKKEPKPEDSEKEKTPTPKIDWEQKYKECETEDDFKNFWNTYYEKEWGANAEVIRNLKVAFIPELEKYGWTEISNPFIHFLKHNLGILKGSNSDSNIKGKYIELHNAVVNSHISAADLKGIGKLGKYNIIFNPNLYKGSSKDMAEYLKHQYDILNKVKTSDTAANLLSTTYKNNTQNFLSNIMLATGKLHSPVDKDNIIGSNLRPLSQIKDIKAEIFPDSDVSEEENVSLDFIDEVINKVSTKEKATQLLAFLFATLRRDYSKTLDEVNISVGKALSALESPSYEAMKTDYETYKLGAKFTTDQVKKLLLGLAKTAGFTINTK